MKRADHGSAGAAHDLKLREHCVREGRKLSEKEKQYIYCETASPNIREVTAFMKSQHHGCLNKTRTRMIPTDMLRWMGGISLFCSRKRTKEFWEQEKIIAAGGEHL